MPELTPSTAVLQTLASQEGGAVKSRGHTSHDLWYAEAPVGSCVALMWLHRLSACIRTGKRSFLRAPPSALFQFIEAIVRVAYSTGVEREQLKQRSDALRQCIGWLEQLEQGKQVAVNLRLETDPKPNMCHSMGKRIRRILGRIASDVDELAGTWEGRVEAQSGPSGPLGPEETEEARHRRRLAEPSEPPEQKRRLSLREERMLLRTEAGLPPE